ncbi:MAG: AbrB/MazE/SpoVT family DNA-binding domain-containing protein [Microcoleaceae cyanobacterium]
MKIDTDGKITIPPEIQEKLGLLPGTEIQLEVKGNTLQICKPKNIDRGRQWVNAMRGKATSGLTTDNIMQLSRES